MLELALVLEVEVSICCASIGLDGGGNGGVEKNRCNVACLGGCFDACCLAVVAGGLGDWVGGDLEETSEPGSESVSHLMISFVGR